MILYFDFYNLIGILFFKLKSFFRLKHAISFSKNWTNFRTCPVLTEKLDMFDRYVQKMDTYLHHVQYSTQNWTRHGKIRPIQTVQ